MCQAEYRTTIPCKSYPCIQEIHSNCVKGETCSATVTATPKQSYRLFLNNFKQPALHITTDCFLPHQTPSTSQPLLGSYWWGTGGRTRPGQPLAGRTMRRESNTSVRTTSSTSLSWHSLSNSLTVETKVSNLNLPGKTEPRHRVSNCHAGILTVNNTRCNAPSFFSFVSFLTKDQRAAHGKFCLKALTVLLILCIWFLLGFYQTDILKLVHAHYFRLSTTTKKA